jgi:hypothetical protein
MAVSWGLYHLFLPCPLDQFLTSFHLAHNDSLSEYSAPPRPIKLSALFAKILPAVSVLATVSHAYADPYNIALVIRYLARARTVWTPALTPQFGQLAMARIFYVYLYAIHSVS